MEDKFTASNGGTVERLSNGRYTVTDNTPQRLNEIATVLGRTSYLDPAQIDTLREFFRAEEDERLGRWRWPENPDYVVYPDSVNTYPPVGAIRVWNLKTAVSRRYRDRGGVDGLGGHFDDAAAAYFDAHPEPNPEPAWASASVISWKEGPDALLPHVALRDPGDAGRRDLGWHVDLNYSGASWHTLDKLVEFIGDAEVTILVPENAS